MDGDNKIRTFEKKSILDAKSDKVGEEMEWPSNLDEKEMNKLKETVIKQKIDAGEKWGTRETKVNSVNIKLRWGGIGVVKRSYNRGEKQTWSQKWKGRETREWIFHHQTKIVRN